MRFPIVYKGQSTGVYYCPDFVCFGDVIVEIKAMKAIGPIEEAQAINYLKVSRKSRALVINWIRPESCGNCLMA